MGNCSTEKQQIGQPQKPQLDQSSHHVPEKVYTKPEQFKLQIPPSEENQIPDKIQEDGLMSRMSINVKESDPYKEFLHYLQNPQPFIDKHFKHDKRSVCPDGQKMGNFEWKKPLQFYKEEPVLWSVTQEIQTADFKMGRLQNSYFVSTLAALAQNPGLFEQIIEQVFDQNMQFSIKGIYGIWFFIDGKWQFVYIDDYFPVAFNNYLFSRYLKDLWVLIIEKAYSKFFKSYHAIEKGVAGHFFTALTGAPTQYLCKNASKPINPDKAWNIVRQAQRDGHYIIASTQSHEDLENSSSYSYPVIETQQIYVLTQTDKKLERILKLDNPWGRYEWKGRWSEYSDVWSEQLRTQLGYQKADQTIMWISIEDLLRHFGQICINRYNSDYINVWHEVTIKQNEIKGFFMKIQNVTTGYLNLYQKDHHHFPKNYNYSMTRLILIEINQETNHFQRIVKQAVDKTYCSTTEFVLQPGLYYIIFEVDWVCNYTKQLTLNIYSDQLVGLTLDPQQINNDSIFNQLIKLFQKSQNPDLEVYAYDQDPDITRTCGQFGGYVYYHYKNNSTKNTTLTENVNLGDSKNVELCDVHGKEVNLKVKPGEQMLIKMKISKESKGDFELKPSFQSKFVEVYSLEDLDEMLRKKPTKIRRRQIEGEPIDVYIRTFEYSGGIALMYQNKMHKFSFIEQITLDINNLTLAVGTMQEQNKINLQLGPNSQKLLSFVLTQASKPYIFKTKVSYYLATPQFQF